MTATLVKHGNRTFWPSLLYISRGHAKRHADFQNGAADGRREAFVAAACRQLQSLEIDARGKLLSAGGFDQDAARRLGGGGEEMMPIGPMFPCLRVGLVANEA